MSSLLWATSVVTIAISTLLAPTRLLLPLLSRSNDVHITFPTSDLRGFRFWLVFLYLISASLLRRLTRKTVNKYLLIDTSDDIDKVQGVQKDDTHTLRGSPVTLSMPFQYTQSSLLQCAKCLHSARPPSEILMEKKHIHLFLSALTEPAMLLLLASRQCPIDSVGAVNVRNRFEIPSLPALRSFLRPPSKGDEEDKREAKVKATLEKGVKRVKRGYEHRIRVELSFDQKILYTQIFTMLVFARHSGPTSTTVKQQEEDLDELRSVGEVHMMTNDPLAWAELSKDWNPIHWIGWAAKLMGFKGVIAHGNHVAAHAIEAWHSHGEREADEPEGGLEWMEVEFKRPVVLPRTLQIVSREGTIRVLEGEKVDVLVQWGAGV